MTDTKPYRPGAIAFILNEKNEMLLVQHRAYGPDDWTQPGGGREGNESAIDNALREVLEELSIPSSQLQVVGQSKNSLTYEFPVDAEKNNIALARTYRGQQKAQIVFRYTGLDTREFPLDTAELKAMQWCPIENLHKFLNFPEQYEKTLLVLEEFNLIDKL